VHRARAHQDAPLHAARQLAHIAVGFVAQAQMVQQLVDPVVVVANAKVAGLKAQRLAHIEKGVKHQFLGDHAQQTPRLGRLGLHITALHPGAA